MTENYRCQIFRIPLNRQVEKKKMSALHRNDDNNK